MSAPKGLPSAAVGVSLKHPQINIQICICIVSLYTYVYIKQSLAYQSAEQTQKPICVRVYFKRALSKTHKQKLRIRSVNRWRVNVILMYFLAPTVCQCECHCVCVCVFINRGRGGVVKVSCSFTFYTQTCNGVFYSFAFFSVAFTFNMLLQIDKHIFPYVTHFGIYNCIVLHFLQNIKVFNKVLKKYEKI